MQITINNVTEEKVQRAMAEIRKNGGTVAGNSFNVKGVAGKYFLHGSTLTIVINSKPWYAPESKIESELRKFFG